MKNKPDKTFKLCSAIAKSEKSGSIKITHKQLVEIIELLKHPEADYRIIATKALGEIGGEEATEALLATFVDKDYQWYTNSAQALVKMGEDIIPLLIPLLGNDKLRWPAAPAWILGKLGNEKVIEPLLRALTTGTPEVQRSIIDALKQMNWIPGNDKHGAIYWINQGRFDKCTEIGVSAIDPLLTKVLHANEMEKLAIETSLAEIGVPGLPKLISSLKTDEPQIYDTIKSVLAKIGSAAFKNLISELISNSELIRDRAKLILIDNRKQTTNLLVASLEHSEKRIRQQAAQILDLIKWQPKDDEQKALQYIAHGQYEHCIKLGKSALNPLYHLLPKADNPNKIKILWTIGKIKNANSTKHLLKYLGDIDEKVRKVAAEALGEIGAPAIDSLIKELNRINAVKNDSAAEALIAMGKIVIAPLLEAFRKSNDISETHVAFILDDLNWKPTKDELGAKYWIVKREWQNCVKIGTQAVPVLVGFLFNPELDLKIGAAETLGEFNDKGAVSGLIEALKDKNKYVVNAAHKSLEKITGEKLPANHLIWTKWYDFSKLKKPVNQSAHT